MPKFYSAREVLKVLKKAGFYQISQKVSHIKLRGIYKGRLQTVVVSNHRQITYGTFQSIMKQADMKVDEFKKLV